MEKQYAFNQTCDDDDFWDDVYFMGGKKKPAKKKKKQNESNPFATINPDDQDFMALINDAPTRPSSNTVAVSRPSKAKGTIKAQVNGSPQRKKTFVPKKTPGNFSKKQMDSIPVYDPYGEWKGPAKPASKIEFDPIRNQLKDATEYFEEEVLKLTDYRIDAQFFQAKKLNESWPKLQNQWLQKFNERKYNPMFSKSSMKLKLFIMNGDDYRRKPGLDWFCIFLGLLTIGACGYGLYLFGPTLYDQVMLRGFNQKKSDITGKKIKKIKDKDFIVLATECALAVLMIVSVICCWCKSCCCPAKAELKSSQLYQKKDTNEKLLKEGGWEEYV